MSRSQERRIISDKIKYLGDIACIDKAIEESKEQTEALEMLRKMLDFGTPLLINRAIKHVGEEHADTNVTIYETLFRIWPEMRQAYQKKRHKAFTEQIPQALAQEIGCGIIDTEHCDG